MPRCDLDRDAGHNLTVAIEQMHPAGFDQRFVVDHAITDRVARMLFAGVPEFAALCEVTRAGQGRDDMLPVIHRVAAAVVPVQMRVDDDVDRIGCESVTAPAPR